MWVPTGGGGRPSTKRESIGMLGGLLLLCTIFAVMKLTGHFTDSWICVFAPLWGPAALIVFVCIGVAPELWAEEKRAKEKRKEGKRK